jgi:pimeloyl-ACP methyl ester carboxylesterase
VPKEFVLVHGASHGAWCWDDVAAKLREAGHRVVTLDLPGHGRRAAEAGRASMESYGRAVADAMARESVSRGVLVGHSMGGPVIQKAAERAPGRVAHLVFLAAVVLPSRGSLERVHLTPVGRALMHGLASARGNGTFAYPAETAWARWMGDLPRSHPAVARGARRPHAAAPAALRGARRLLYLRAPSDAADLRALPRRSRRGPRARGGLRGEPRGIPVDMSTAHDPMLSAPEALARLLEKIPA